MHPLTAYVSMDRRLALARGERLPDRVQGAVLFADVSESMSLTAVLARALGPQRGAEELTYHLNRIFKPLIAKVHDYGGSVVNFAGDGITCWFDRDNGRRATACAMAMQQVMDNVEALATPSGEAIAIKIAVVSGAARRFAVGNPHIQMIDVLAGGLLDRMVGAEDLLRQGEVGVGAEVLAWLGSQAQIGSWRTAPDGESFAIIERLREAIPPTPWQESPELDAPVARRWLPPLVARRVELGEESFVAELRLVVPMFLRFTGVNYDKDDAAGEKLDAYVKWVQAVLAHYEGHLLAMTMGDKGSSMSISFGAPVAHEDDPARAVAAAIELRSPPADLSFIKDVCIGVTQGRLYIGACGCETRRTYAELGNEVNIAYRLMSYAEPGQILVSKRVVDAAVDYEYDPLGLVKLKGLREPLPVFDVSGERRGQIGRTVTGHTSPPMVGREAELATLSGRLQALREGQGGCVIIEGEAGIGKSRLVEELQDRARAAGIFTLVGCSDAVERATAYYAWRSIFYTLFGLPESEEALATEAIRAQVLGQIEDDAYLRERAPLLDAVLPLQLPDNDLTVQMAGEVRASNTRHVLVRLLLCALQGTTSTLLLVLEDAHWLDSASWALLSDVRQRVQPLLLVVVMRSLTDPVPTEYEQLRDAPDTHHLLLDVLSQDDVAALACRRLGARALSPEVVGLICEKAEGHPLFSEEVAYALRDAGLVFIDEQGVCRLASGADADAVLAFPDTIQGVITSRIDRLPPAQQSLLKVASVIGRVFAFRILRDVYPLEADKPKLLTYLDDLENTDLTLKQSLEPDLIYVFKHVITQEVAYNLMLFAQRRDLHRAVARWYEWAFAADLSPYYGLLAHHWERAGESERAMGYLEKAGEQALANYANEEASAFLGTALALAASGEVVVDEVRRARRELQLGEAYVNQSKYVEGRDHLEEGLALLGRPVPRSAAAQAVGTMQQVGQQVLHRLSPGRYVGRLAERRDTLRLVSRAYENLAEAGYVSGETALSLYSALAALNSAESAGESPELARGYVAAGVMMGFIPIHRYAGMYIDRAFSTVQQIDNMPVRSYVASAAGCYYAGVGNWHKTEELFSLAIQLSERLGDVRGWEGSVGNLGFAKLLQGDFSGGLELAQKVYNSACTRSDALFQAIALALKASYLYHLGKPDEAMECLEPIRPMISEYSDVSNSRMQFSMHGVLLGIYLQHADHRQMLSVVHQLSDLIVKSSFFFDFGNLEGYANLAEACLTLWEADLRVSEVKELADKACKYLKKYARTFPIGRPRAGLWRGWYDWLSGKRTKAHKRWQKSLALARQLEMAYDEGLAHYTIGRHLDAGHPERVKHLERATDIFSRLEAGYGLRCARSELESPSIAER